MSWKSEAGTQNLYEVCMYKKRRGKIKKSIDGHPDEEK